tara:strand:- start:1650 stop:1856 length:207 start_codon:yes stop_codon:yes gene_type:complete
MYLSDDIQKTLRSLGKITEKEVVKKEGDIYLAFNVLTNENRILSEDHHLIESLSSKRSGNRGKKILKG